MTELTERRNVYRTRNLATYPDAVPGDEARIAGVAVLLERLDAPLRLRLPAFDLLVEIDAQVGAHKTYLLAVDDYEMADLVLLHRHLAPGRRAMVLGGGLGIAAALAARIARPAPVVVVEPNAGLHARIARQAAINGGEILLDGRVVVGETANRLKKTVGFLVDDDIWLSRIGEGADATQVPVVAFAELCAAHAPDLVLMDIEGAETDVLASPVPGCVRTLIVEIHTPDIGGEATARIISAMADQGLRLIDQMALVWVFSRTR